MKHVITAKLKLHTTSEQLRSLRTTQLAYRDALNAVSRYAFAHGKMSNKAALQSGTYTAIRQQFHIGAQMACSVARHVGATYRTLWTRAQQHAEARKAGLTKKRYKGLDQAPTYVSPTLEYQYGKDYRFKKAHHLSILTLEGRVVVPYTGYHKHVALIEKGAEMGAAKLWYDQPRKTFYLLVSLAIEVAEPTPQQHTNVVGVDVGIRYFAVTADTTSQSTFHSGKAIKAKADHYARLRKRLQQKGTRAATRRLKAISGRERRLRVADQPYHCQAHHCTVPPQHDWT